MMPAIRAGALYFALVFAAGFALGALRGGVIVPRVGALVAVALELPFMLAISWVACGFVIARCGVASKAQAAVMGAVAFALLMAAEAALGVFGFGRTLAGHLAAYAQPHEMLGLLGQIAFALMPLARAGSVAPPRDGV